tara:strand:- start:22028 stop:22381 length:354 start_codon:yes stop_codon:yes gene_type:complete
MNTLTTTLEIARLGNKTHAEVLRYLREAQEAIPGRKYNHLWNISRYKNAAGVRCIMYRVTKKGWLLLSKHFDANTRLQMIDKCTEEDNTLQDQLRTQKILAERAWDAADRNDLYKRL